MTSRAVHWHEGMFLRPHQFQAEQRHRYDSARLDHKLDIYYNWGVAALDLDTHGCGLCERCEQCDAGECGTHHRSELRKSSPPQDSGGSMATDASGSDGWIRSTRW